MSNLTKLITLIIVVIVLIYAFFAFDIPYKKTNAPAPTNTSATTSAPVTPISGII